VSGIGGGFTVDQAGIQQFANSVHLSAEDVRSCVKTLLHRPGFTEAVFGDCGVVAAVTEFFRTRVAELSIIAGGLDETSTTLLHTSASYDNLDQTGERIYRPAGS
jgi:hypothetical protein